jgi:hypothetical protein
MTPSSPPPPRKDRLSQVHGDFSDAVWFLSLFGHLCVSDLSAVSQSAEELAMCAMAVLDLRSSDSSRQHDLAATTALAFALQLPGRSSMLHEACAKLKKVASNNVLLEAHCLAAVRLLECCARRSLPPAAPGPGLGGA